ncbi:baseplate assembly protein, partial [Asaia sp. W19]
MVDHVSPQSTFAGLTNGSAIDAAVDRAISAMGTPILVQVKAVHGGGASLVGQVDVQPMVHMQDGQGKTYPHGVITGVPYLRVQGGTSALIIDPMVGDIGYVMVSGRDIQNVITSRQP